MARALTLDDIDRLGELLARIPEPFVPMEPDALDGFLTAIALMQKPPRIDEWIGFVYDIERRPLAKLPAAEEQAELRRLILARGAEIEASILAQKAIDPIIFEDTEEDAPEDPFAALHPFADGFAMACANWPELMKNNSQAVQAALVGILRYESDESDENDEDESGDENQPAAKTQDGAASEINEDKDNLPDEDGKLEALDEISFANLDEALADLAACVQEIAEVTRAEDIAQAAQAGRTAHRLSGGAAAGKSKGGKKAKTKAKGNQGGRRR